MFKHEFPNDVHPFFLFSFSNTGGGDEEEAEKDIGTMDAALFAKSRGFYERALHIFGSSLPVKRFRDSVFFLISES